MKSCIEGRCLGPELALDELVTYPRGSLGYTCAKVMGISATPPECVAAAHSQPIPSQAAEVQYGASRATQAAHCLLTAIRTPGP
jgi:hypothetical protein